MDIKDKGCDTTIHYVITDTKDGQIDAALDIPIEYIEKEYELEPPTTYTKFEKQIAILFDKCFSTLIRKDVEYAGHGDAFEAFREAAQVEGVIPEEIARRYRLKHDMSLKKMINDLQNGRDENLTEEFIKEKCGDIICYTALIYGMLAERIRDEVQICE
ncbi:MAG: hypothetical protein WC343_14595 [Bacilli bacterium]